jgi:Ras-related protein Rab-1A
MSHISTIGVDYKTLSMLLKERTVKLDIWDTAGQERYKSITQSYYRGVNGVAFVFDITNKQSFANIAKWITDIKKETQDFSSIIIGNKIDMNDMRTVTYEEASEFSKKFGAEYIETSAKNSQNIDEIFKKFAVKLVK